EPKTDPPSQEPAPLSPMQGGDEYRLFQEIASNSLHRKKPAAAAAGSAPLVNGKATASGGGGGGGANHTSIANGGSASTGMSSR
ncbi:unnamed protein product, partial [Ectocarpus sp. 12 AP-2014]